MRSTSMWGSLRISSRQLAKSCSMCTVCVREGATVGSWWGEKRGRGGREKRDTQISGRRDKQTERQKKEQMRKRVKSSKLETSTRKERDKQRNGMRREGGREGRMDGWREGGEGDRVEVRVGGRRVETV